MECRCITCNRNLELKDEMVFKNIGPICMLNIRPWESNKLAKNPKGDALTQFFLDPKTDPDILSVVVCSDYKINFLDLYRKNLTKFVYDNWNSPAPFVEVERSLFLDIPRYGEPVVNFKASAEPLKSITVKKAEKKPIASLFVTENPTREMIIRKNKEKHLSNLTNFIKERKRAYFILDKKPELKEALINSLKVDLEKVGLTLPKNFDF